MKHISILSITILVSGFVGMYLFYKTKTSECVSVAALVTILLVSCFVFYFKASRNMK